MKRILLLIASVLLVSGVYGCSGLGTGAGSGSSFQGGTEAGNPPTDGGLFGGTEAGNPPPGEQGTDPHEHNGQTAGDEYCSVNGTIVHCGSCIDGKTADGKEDCVPVDIDAGIDIDPEHIQHLGDHNGDGTEQRKPISIDPNIAGALGHSVVDMGVEPVPIDKDKDKPTIKMPISGSSGRIRLPLPPDPQN